MTDALGRSGVGLLARLGAAALVVFGVCTLVFLLIHLVPGDPVEAMLGEGARARRTVRP